jgi:pyridoxine 4-dehydrogenase
VRHIGVSNVNLAQLATAQSLCTVVSVQNAYNVARRQAEAVLRACAEQGIAFIPHSGNIIFDDAANTAIGAVAGAHGVSTAQVANAWLLAHSPITVPIPGTSKRAHLDDNVDAAWLMLTPDEIAALDAVGAATAS